jgi:two-component system chemotaxis response regulator CheY
MVPKFFGQFLLENGVVVSDDLLTALNIQHEKNQKLGEIAVSEGYLTSDQVEKIRYEQKSKDMLFGQLVIQNKLLTDDQLKKIIRIQKNSHVYLGEVLVQEGIVSQSVIDKQLKIFKDEQKELDTLKIKFDFEHEYNPYIEDFIDLSVKLLLRVAGIESKIGKIKIREKSTETLYLTVQIPFTGDINAILMLSLSRDVVFQLVENFLEEKITDTEIATENAAEFFNVVCGNLSTKMQIDGKKNEIKIPKLIKGEDSSNITFNENEKCVVAPLITTAGYCELSTVFQKSDKDSPLKSTEKKKVLIIDDSTSVGLKIRSIINKMSDFELAFHAKSAEDGIKKYKEIHPDLVTMDIVLPGMNGIEAIKEIKSLDPKANIVVISSVAGGQENLFKAIKAGAKNVIVKPFEESRVIEIFYQSV